MSVIGIVVVGCFVALFARLWYLQVMEAPQLEVQAAANRTRVVAVEAPRGRILDRNGKVIVDNKTSLVVTMDRSKLKALDQADRDALVSKLAATLTDFGTPTKTDAIESALSDLQYDDLQPVPVATGISEELMVYLSERADEFPSVDVERESVRDYKYGAAAGNILGYVGRITEEKLAEVADDPGVDPDGVPKQYQPDSTIGLAGVEASYEKDLRGTPGTEVLEIDANNLVVGTQSYQPPRPGNDVQLNIDIDLQIQAEEALRAQLDATRGGLQRDSTQVYVKEAPAGSLVVLDPNTGGVLALASYPSYDPSAFSGGISQELYDQLSDVNGASALVDRSISGQYAPGSTFKLVTATAGLENGLITATTPYNDIGYVEIGVNQERYYNAGRAVYGTVNVTSALTKSVDTFFYTLGIRMDGTVEIQDEATQYGFNEQTGIDLPNESSGEVLTPDSLQAKHDSCPACAPDPEWYTGRSKDLAIGQQVVLVTPLQLANAYGSFGNGGSVYVPHVAAQVLLPGSPTDLPIALTDPANVVRVVDPVVARTVDLPPETYDPIYQGLHDVTRYGTAEGAFAGFDQSQVSIIGKTGTAQVVGKADTSLFAAYSTRGAPEYAVAAVLEESGFGSDAAAPLVRHMYEYLYGQQATGFGSFESSAATGD